MQRISGLDAVNNRFSDGDPIAGKKGTVVTADFMNAVQEELATFMESMGIVLSTTDNTQLRQAVLAIQARANTWTAAQQFSGDITLGGQLYVDSGGQNSGTVSAKAIRFGGASGEGIGSQRTAGADQYGISIFTQHLKRLSIRYDGTVDFHGNPVINMPAPSWTAPSLAGWVNGAGDSAAGYWKDPCGVVHLKGYATANTSPGEERVLFTLPPGSRPKAARKLCAVDGTAGTMVPVTISADGTVTVGAFSYPHNIYFDQISFVAEQ
jgi:hypothetical protein